jgi:hypothetical protein
VSLLSAAATRTGAGSLQGCPFPTRQLRGKPIHAGSCPGPHSLPCFNRFFEQGRLDPHGLSLAEVIFETGVAIAGHRGSDSNELSRTVIQFHFMNLLCFLPV